MGMISGMFLGMAIENSRGQFVFLIQRIKSVYFFSLYLGGKLKNLYQNCKKIEEVRKGFYKINRGMRLLEENGYADSVIYCKILLSRLGINRDSFDLNTLQTNKTIMPKKNLRH